MTTLQQVTCGLGTVKYLTTTDEKVVIDLTLSDEITQYHFQTTYFYKTEFPIRDALKTKEVINKSKLNNVKYLTRFEEQEQIIVGTYNKINKIFGLLQVSVVKEAFESVELLRIQRNY